jgi:prephenate dehydrogenase
MSELAVLGLGLIGGSIGKRMGPTHTVVGYDHDALTSQRALALGACSRVATTVAEAVASADLVVLAVPVDAMPGLFTEIAPYLTPGAIVTDVGSTKTAVVERGQVTFGDRFVGGHPMAGSETHGVEAADVSLFEDAWWILTPTQETASSAYQQVAALAVGCGARPIALAPEVHDSLIARLSHVPQLAASAVVAMAASDVDNESLLGLAANGFRDVTRIAASDPDMWVAIVRSNRLAILEALGELEGALGELRTTIEAQDWSALHSSLRRARAARLELFAKPVYTGEPVGISLLIPDRPGVLAEVTTAAGELGANIEDLRILHSTEGGRGRLELVVAGRAPATELVATLTELGYHVDVGVPE